MNDVYDDRMPIGPAATRGGLAAYLVEQGCAVPEAAAVAYFTAGRPHSIGCAYCAARSPAAIALAGLFAASVRGETPVFTHVIVVTASAAGEAAVRAALASDALVRARFVWAGPALYAASPSPSPNARCM